MIGAKRVVNKSSFVFLICILQLLINSNLTIAQGQPYKNVFKGLDGKWEGTFYVYSDTRGQQKGNVQPKKISYELLQELPLKTDLTIAVTQIYKSENPFFQRVEITDRYDGKVVKSSGVNKVVDGKLLCIVDKPDEQVVHNGSTDGNQTIIWERDIREPLKIEYFRETVTPESYTIIGWGYYGEDDPELSPKTWFFGDYKRLKGD